MRVGLGADRQAGRQAYERNMRFRLQFSQSINQSIAKVDCVPLPLPALAQVPAHLSCPPGPAAAVMNVLLHLSRQYSQKGRGTVFLIINFAFVAATLKVRRAFCLSHFSLSCCAVSSYMPAASAAGVNLACCHRRPA